MNADKWWGFIKHRASTAKIYKIRELAPIPSLGDATLRARELTRVVMRLTSYSPLLTPDQTVNSRPNCAHISQPGTSLGWGYVYPVASVRLEAQMNVNYHYCRCDRSLATIAE